MCSRSTTSASVTTGDGGPPPPADELSVSRFEVGDEVVVALDDSFFMMREGPVDRLYPLGGGAGVFDIAADRAWSQATAEAVALDELATRLEQVRGEDHSEWDYSRYPPTAAQQLASIEERVTERRAKNERIRNDPNNVCNFVGDPERAQEWLDANPDRGVTLEDMLDPTWFGGVCDGFEEAKAQNGESTD